MVREHPIRYSIAFLLAVAGGVVSQVSADALGADGVVAFGLFVGCLVIFCLPATALTATLDSRGGKRAAEPKRR